MKLLITGVTSGIGKSLTERLLKDGHTVFGIARRKDELEKLSKQFSNFNYLQIDLLGDDSLIKILREMKQVRFTPDVVVLNAALNLEDVKNQFNHENFSKTFTVNFNRNIKLIDQLTNSYKNRIHFIAISSTARYRPGFKSIAYSASKAALSNAFRGFATHYSQNHIFSTIHFGPIKTDVWTGPRWLPVPSSQMAARFVTTVIFKHKSKSYYYPKIYNLFTIVSGLLPSKFFWFVYKKAKSRD